MNKLKTESPSSIEAHLAELYGRINYERQDRVTPRHFKLRNMRELLSRLGDPHLNYPVIHVAGTKGKGSVSTMVGQILTESGRRTGVYTSPHLETIHQRMAVDGAMITDNLLAETLTTLEPVIRAMDEEAASHNYRHLTFFEITTAAAFLFFANQKCDAVVLEVGLGGRMDSTNVCQPVTSIITNISVDHTRQLGDTVDKIAYEKAGIIKPGVPVVSGAVDAEAAKVISQVANDQSSPLVVLGQDFKIENENSNEFSWTGKFSLESADFVQPESGRSTPRTDTCSIQLDHLKLRLIGQHQRVNAAVAVAAIETLNARSWNISEDAIRTGLSRATLAGRTEVVSESPTIIIDMAHNVASIEALVQTLKHDISGWKTAAKKTLILATSRDKDVAGMMGPLVKAFDRIVLTRYQDNPRGKSEDEMMEIASGIRTELLATEQPAAELSIEPNPEVAWAKVSQDLNDGDLVCITGSVFLVAELRNTIIMAVNGTSETSRIADSSAL